MDQNSPNAEILDFEGSHTLQNARLDDIKEIKSDSTHQLILEYRELELTEPSTISQKDGKLWETLTGHYVPHKLTFGNIKWIMRQGLYENLDDVAPDDDCRFLQGILHWEKPAGRWRTPDREPLFLLFHSSSDANLVFSATETHMETGQGDGERVTIRRDWSSPPPIPPGIVYIKTSEQKERGGDSIPIRLDKQEYEDLLFVGSLEDQHDSRPDVNSILNLCEIKNPWLQADVMPPEDRWSRHGEGNAGMSLAEIVQEAEWAIDRLRSGRRVLVHCEMGFNRSVTVACAILIMLEELSAEDALYRIRQHHRWARPDVYHWLKLRWLAENQES